MNSCKIQLTGCYPKFNQELKTTKIIYNYVVVSGDVKEYSADKELAGVLSLQDDGEFKGAPRFVSTKNLGETAEINRVTKKDGTTDWYNDNLEELLIQSEIASLSPMEQQAIALDRARQAMDRARATALSLKAKRNAVVSSDLKQS